MERPRDLSCSAKLAHVVLENQGPLSPAEIATEARLSEADAEAAIHELLDGDLVECVCGVCETREEVYALRETPPAGEQHP